MRARSSAGSARWAGVRCLARNHPSLEPARQRAQPEQSADTGLPTNGNVAERHDGCVGAIRTAALGRRSSHGVIGQEQNAPMLPGTGRKGASISAVRRRCLEAPTRARLAIDDVLVRNCRLGNTTCNETLPSGG